MLFCLNGRHVSPSPAAVAREQLPGKKKIHLQVTGLLRFARCKGANWLGESWMCIHSEWTRALCGLRSVRMGSCAHTLT